MLAVSAKRESLGLLRLLYARVFGLGAGCLGWLGLGLLFLDVAAEDADLFIPVLLEVKAVLLAEPQLKQIVV